MDITIPSSDVYRHLDLPQPIPSNALAFPTKFRDHSEMAHISISRRNSTLKRHREAQALALEAVRKKRLLLGLGTLALLGASQIIPGFHLEKVSLLLALPIYLYFVGRSRNQQAFLQKLESLQKFYAKQAALPTGEALPAEDLESFPLPDLCRDLDLHELFPYLDMSLSQQGQKKLKSWICGQSQDISIAKKHQALKALAEHPGPLRRLQILFPEKKVDLDSISETTRLPLVSNPPPWRWILPLLWAGGIASLGLSSLFLAKLILFGYCSLTLIFLQKTGGSFSRIQSLLQDLEGLEPFFLQLNRWKNKKIPGLQILLSSEPYHALKTFRRFVALMSLQGNPMLFYLLNFTFPWSLLIRELAESQRKKLAKQFPPWKEEIVYLDAIGSLATLYIYQTATLPTVASKSPLELTAIRHPLIPRDTIVTNSFFQGEHQVFLITGSNMSGKSTFLRAFGMNYCLAQMGAPVFAESFLCPDAKIVSCIRVSDSLRDGQSYFYAEVRRLKKILDDALKTPIIFLIDEPLRGTNNKERLAGNRAYLQQLIQTSATGFLSTHDLEMTHLEDHIPSLCNYNFSDTWVDEKLFFDYKIRKGPSQTTNALKIMAQEGLLQPPSEG